VCQGGLTINTSQQEEINKRKQEIREKIWRILEERNIALFPRPVFGRIPNFIGSDIAAKKLSELSIFKKANVIFANPDSPQQHIRRIALEHDKVVIMATPRLRQGFLVLNPANIPRKLLKFASTIKGAFKLGRLTEDLSRYHIDLKIVGSVAVWNDGSRVGKGGGYSDIEFGILREFGWISEDTPVVTTVHDVQFHNNIPMTQHDVPIDIIVTPTKVLEVKRIYPKPKGIYWDEIPHEKIEQIPILKKMLRQKL